MGTHDNSNNNMNYYYQPPPPSPFGECIVPVPCVRHAFTPERLCALRRRVEQANSSAAGEGGLVRGDDREQDDYFINTTTTNNSHVVHASKEAPHPLSLSSSSALYDGLIRDLGAAYEEAKTLLTLAQSASRHYARSYRRGQAELNQRAKKILKVWDEAADKTTTTMTRGMNEREEQEQEQEVRRRREKVEKRVRRVFRGDDGHAAQPLASSLAQKRGTGIEEGLRKSRQKSVSLPL